MDLAVVHEVRCPVRLDTTWDYVAEHYFDHHSSWDPAIVAMQPSQPGPLRPGLTGVETRRFLGRQRAGFEITEVRLAAPLRAPEHLGPVRARPQL